MRLEEEISHLKKVVESLSARVIQLEKENIQLRVENTALKQENQNLRLRLGKNSKNSNRPPSSDGYSKKPALPKSEPKALGGQHGHAGKTLERVSTPDQIIDRFATECSLCHQPLSPAASISIASTHQVFDIPAPKLIASEYRLHISRCTCGCRTKAQLPAGLSGAPVQYGSSVKGLSVLLNTDFKIPFKKITRLFRDLFGYDFNESTAVSANESAFSLLAEEESYITKQLLSSQTLCADETGIRSAGVLHWLHVSANDRYTYFFVHPKRGKEALKDPECILPRYKGYLMHDCLASYWHCTDATHLICNAHILRELQALIERGSPWAQSMHSFLLDLYTTTKKAGLILEQEAKARIFEQFERICQDGLREEPPPISENRRGRVPKSKGRNLIERLQKYREGVLEFAFNHAAPFTNNQAERDLRPVKIKQKVSACFRTIAGAKNYARIQGFISTLRKQGFNPFHQLIKVFDNQFAWA